MPGRRGVRVVESMIQDAPLSGVTLPVPLLAGLARQMRNVSYLKIEVPGAAAKLRASGCWSWRVRCGRSRSRGGSRSACLRKIVREL